MLGTLWPVVSCCRQSDVEDGRLIKDDRGLTDNSVLQVAQKNDMESKYYCQVDFNISFDEKNNRRKICMYNF